VVKQLFVHGNKDLRELGIITRPLVAAFSIMSRGGKAR